MTAFELRPLTRMGENAWKLIVYGLIIKFNALGPSIDVPGLGTRPYLARASTTMLEFLFARARAWPVNFY